MQIQSSDRVLWVVIRRMKRLSLACSVHWPKTPKSGRETALLSKVCHQHGPQIPCSFSRRSFCSIITLTSSSTPLADRIVAVGHRKLWRGPPSPLPSNLILIISDTLNEARFLIRRSTPCSSPRAVELHQKSPSPALLHFRCFATALSLNGHQILCLYHLFKKSKPPLHTHIKSQINRSLTAIAARGASYPARQPFPTNANWVQRQRTQSIIAAIHIKRHFAYQAARCLHWSSVLTLDPSTSSSEHTVSSLSKLTERS